MAVIETSSGPVWVPGAGPAQPAQPLPPPPEPLEPPAATTEEEAVTPIPAPLPFGGPLLTPIPTPTPTYVPTPTPTPTPTPAWSYATPPPHELISPEGELLEVPEDLAAGIAEEEARQERISALMATAPSFPSGEAPEGYTWRMAQGHTTAAMELVQIGKPPSTEALLAGLMGFAPAALVLAPAAPALFLPVVKAGAAVVTVTGGAALIKGAVTPPPKIETGPYKVVAGTTTAEDISKVGERVESAWGEVGGLESGLREAEAAYSDISTRVNAAATALSGWDKYLVGGELDITDEQYAQYQGDYQDWQRLSGEFSSIEASYKGIYSEYQTAYGRYQDVYGEYGDISGSLLEARAEVDSYLNSSTGKIDVNRMVGTLGETGATTLLARAGYKPELSLEIYEKLSADIQAYYTPSEKRASVYEPGIWGAYSRGVETLYQPAVDWLLEKGPVGELGAGVFQYLVPHTLVTELYPEKGPVAFTTLIPHFGPTAAYTGITWEEQSLIGKAAGIGFAALPYVVGPAGALASRVFGPVGRVPGVRTAVAPVKWGLETISPITGAIERLAPWQMAYTAGRAVPGYGQYAYQRGWMGPRVSYSELLRRWGAQPVVPGETMATWNIKTAAEMQSHIDIAAAAQGMTVEQFLRTVPPAPTQPGTVWAAPSVGVSIAPGISLASLSRFQMAGAVIPRVGMALTLTAPALAGAVFPMLGAGAVISTVQQMQIDIATADQMLSQNQITSTQHQLMVQQIQLAQEKAVTQQQSQQLTQQETQIVYQQEVQDTVQQVLSEEQQIQYEQQIQQQTEQTVIQQTIQQQTLYQQMQQQELQQQQQWDQMQLIQQKPMTPPIVPPLIPPLVLFPGAPRFGGSWVRRRKAGKRKYSEKLWPFEELVIFMPEALSLKKKAIRLRKKGELSYGGRLSRERMGRAKGIRV